MQIPVQLYIYVHKNQCNFGIFKQQCIVWRSPIFVSLYDYTDLSGYSVYRLLNNLILHYYDLGADPGFC